MMSAVLYIVLATATLAIDAAEFENEPREAARAERDAWEIAWSVALNEHLSVSRSGSVEWSDKRRSRFSESRKRIADWVIYRYAREIYEADREGQVAAAGEEYEFALKIYEGARMKYNAAEKAESAATIAVAKAARAVYETGTGRERDITAWKNYQTALKTWLRAKIKLVNAYKEQKSARYVVRDALDEAVRAAENAVRKANPSQR